MLVVYIMHVILPHKMAASNDVIILEVRTHTLYKELNYSKNEETKKKTMENN